MYIDSKLTIHKKKKLNELVRFLKERERGLELVPSLRTERERERSEHLLYTIMKTFNILIIKLYKIIPDNHRV